MEKFKNYLYIYIVFLSFFISFFLSCDNNSGLGEQVDLDAPALSVKSMTSDESDPVTSFSGGVYCHKSVSFAGTATDNNRIEKVYTQIKWAGDSSEFADFKTATISGNDWNLTFTFENEGIVLLKFIATDPAGNVASKSTKTIILFVDEDAPVGSAWYINRKINGIQYKLHELDYLKSLDLNESSNIDAAQNVFFSISGAFTDTMGISEDNPPEISLYTESGEKITTIDKTEDSSVYQPEFEIKHGALVKADSSLAAGLHYIQVRYSASDVVEVPSSNSVTDEEFDGGWFIWYPESDIPRYELSEEITESDNEKSITVYVNSSFSVTVFDDDALESIEYSFAYKDEEEENQTDSKKISINDSTINSGEREKVLTIKLPSTPQTATLKITAQGKESDTDGGETLEEKITVNVIDATAPMILITSPKNNSVPPVTMTGTENAKVTISGTSLDVSGCKYLEFVWVPDSIAETTAQKSTIAKDFLSTLKTDTLHDSYAPSGTTAKKTEIKDVGVLWSVPLTNKKTSSGFISHEFSFDVDLFNDFSSSDSAFTSENKTTSDKFFVARLIRSGDTGTYAEYKLAGDISNPTISPVTPSGDMAIVSGEEELVLEFKGVKESGMPMDTDAYEIRRVDEKANDGKFGTYDSLKGYATVSGSYDSESGTYKASAISRDTLQSWKDSGTKPKFQFFAKDLLGNEGKDQYTIVISTLPVLKSVTSPSSTLLKKGDELLINAVFDNTVSVSDTNGLYVKLTGFSDSAIRKATYKSGYGSTTLIFSYTIQEGDSSDKVEVSNEKVDSISGDIGSPIVGLSEKVATLLDSNGSSIVKTDNLLQNKKTIVVDGISPKVRDISITSDIDSSKANYTKDSVVYLKEGRTLSVTLTTSEAIVLSGSPEFILSTKSNGSVKLPFTGTSGTSISFSKKIESTDANGELTYIPSSCIDASTVTDTAGNQIVLETKTSATDSGFAVDTVAPATPTVTVDTSSNNYSGIINGTMYFAASASFTARTAASDSSVKSVEYSPDGGSTWIQAASGETVTLSADKYSSVQLVCRATDYAGNVSALSDTKNLQINSTFPAFTIECTNADGNYKAGSKLVFKVSFDDKVNYSSSSLYSAAALANGTCAYIQLSALNSSETCGGGSNNGRAYLSDKSGNAITSDSSSSVDTVYFTYEAQDPDEFTLKVASNAVCLTGFTDLYGISQGTKSLDDDYKRESLKCDGVAPKVKTMTPVGTETTATDGTNVYTSGNTITLKFSEEIQKSSGNITLRQVAGWAIPPVLSASDFTTICNAITSDEKEILSMQEDGSDMEDSENLLGANIKNAQDKYHGTGQYVGPYKKSMQGLKLSSGKYVPDTSTKYVLDFDIDIFETDTTHPIGKTFQEVYAATAGYSYTSQTGKVNVITPTTTRTAGQLREVLESAGYHERVLDVTSSAVVIDSDNKTVTITFQAGLCDTSDDLPLGRKWELVIEKGAFMDMTGNEFGAEANGILAKADAVQNGGKQYTVGTSVTTEYGTYSGSWARAQSSTTSPTVLICNGANEYFWSSGCATPVVRVDRYSYRLGAVQSDSSGATQTPVLTDAVKPTGYVRVKIDCETPDAVIKYNDSNKTSNTRTDENFDNSTDIKEAGYSDAPCYSYISSTADLTSSTFESTTPSSVYSAVFACGNGDYTKSCKQYVIATATANSSTSSKALEGVFQTVARFNSPIGANGTLCADCGTGATDVSIRGTTGWAGEPNISPFPLRDSQVASPFLCRTFRESTQTSTSTSKDYYWVSYEILVGTSFSNYSWHKSNYYDWAKNWGYMRCGEFTNCTGMKNWGYN